MNKQISKQNFILLLFIIIMMITALLPELAGFKRLLIIIEFIGMIYLLIKS